MIKFTNGLIKSEYDPDDYLMETFVEPSFKVPEEFSLREEMSPCENQKNEGACAGFAGTMVKNYQEEKNHIKRIRLSPRFIYELAKKESGHKEGTTLKAIVKVLKSAGIPKWTTCPYKAKEKVELTPKMFKEAQRYVIKSYARIRNIKELKRAIYEEYPIGGPVIIGVKVFKGFVSKESRKTGVVPNTKWFERLLGGHAVTACGWSDNSPYFKNDGHIECQGSYGTKFGDDGYHYFSYKYIKKHMLDAMATVDSDIPEDFVKRVKDLNFLQKETSWV